MAIELVMPSKHLVLNRPLFLPSIFPSIRVFSNESAPCIRWPEYWSFSFSISPSNEYSGLISFKIDWFDLLAVQGTLKRLAQHYLSKASILWHSAFFIFQLSHPYMTTGKTSVLTTWGFFFFSRCWRVLFYFIFLIFFISWRLITLQYCSDFCHTLTWISHGYTCIPHGTLLENCVF